MAVFRVEKNKGYTVMSNHHLRDRDLSLKAKGLLSQMLSLPEDWDFTLAGLSRINRESIDAIRSAIRELEEAGYITRSRERDEKGRLRGADYVIYEQPVSAPPKLSQVFRLSPGADMSAKFLSLGQGFTVAFENALPSVHPLDLLIGVLGAAAIRLAVYLKGKNAKKYRKGMEYGSARWSA